MKQYLKQEKNKWEMYKTMTNYYEEKLREIGAMLHLQRVQDTPWMKQKLLDERSYILKELEKEIK